MNDLLDPAHEDDARYMAWLSWMAARSGGVAELVIIEVDGAVVAALRATTEEE